MSVSRKQMKSLIAASDYFPFSLLYALVYRFGIFYLTYRLKNIEAVKGMYTTGSFALGDLCHGISDVDYFIVIGARHRDDAIVRTAVDLALKDAIALFPFLGPLSEKSQSIVVVDEQGAYDNLNFFYRSKTCSFRKVFERKDFHVDTEQSVEHLAILSELNILMTSVVKALRRGRDNGYFWKSKLRSLLVLLVNQSNPDKAIGELDLLQSEKDLLGEYWSKPNHRLFKVENIVSSEQAFNLFFRLMDIAFQKWGFDAIADVEVIVQPACSDTYIAHRQDTGHNATFEYEAGGLVMLDDMPIEFDYIDLRDVQYSEAQSQLKNAASGDRECVVIINRFILRLTREDCGISNIYGSPFAFEDVTTTKKMLIKTPVLERLLKEARTTVDELRNELVDTTGGRRDRDSEHHSTAPYLLLVEDDLKMLTAFIDCYRLSKVSADHILLFKSVNEVFHHLDEVYPEHSEFLHHLRSYYDCLKGKSNSVEVVGRLPSNFFGYATKFFSAVIFGGELPSKEQLKSRLSLSLCICTKDRPTFLATLLNSVMRQARAPEEIVVIDNSTSEETFCTVQRFVHDLPIKYVRDTRPSLPALRNRAIDESVGQIICFTDDDCILDPQYIAHVERTFLRSRQIGAVGGTMKHMVGERSSPTELFHLSYLG